MLQAPTNDRKTKAEASSKTAEYLPEYEQSSQLMGGIGRSRQSQPLQQRENLAALQKAYGNQAVLRMKGRSPAANPLQGGVLQRKCACGSQGSSNKRQPNSLIINQPNDIYEQQADRVAEQVIRSKNIDSEFGKSAELNAKYRLGASSDRNFIVPVLTLNQNSPLSQFKNLVQRQEDELDAEIEPEMEQQSPIEEDEVVDETEIEEEEWTGDETGRPKLENSAINSSQATPIQIPQRVGRPLETNVRQFMESCIGRDFSQVRIHTDADSVSSAKQLHAEAYTVRSNIYFNQGRYNPESVEGQKLLAHELTHVVQQTQTSQAIGYPQTLVQRQRRRGGTKPRQRGGAVRRRMTCHHGDRKPCGPNTCDNNCARGCNPVAHHPNCGNETCGTGGADNSSNFIRHIDVSRTTQEMRLEWGSATRVRHVERSILTSPNPTGTPTGSFRIGEKCGSCHTNMNGAGMGWFTGFHNSLEYGFHNSQTVARGVSSAGCVRVAPCVKAREIHDNTASGVTTVCIHNGGGWGCDRRPPTVPRRTSGRTSEGAGSQESSLVSNNESSFTSETAGGEEELNV